MASRGRSRSTFRRLCSRAPRTTRRSATAFSSPDHEGGAPVGKDTTCYSGPLTKRRTCRQASRPSAHPPCPQPPDPQLRPAPGSSRVPCGGRGWPRTQPKGAPWTAKPRNSRPGSESNRPPAQLPPRADRRAGGRAVPAARLDPRARAHPPGPQRGRPVQPAALGAYRHHDPDVPERGGPGRGIEGGAGRSAADLTADVARARPRSPPTAARLPAGPGRPWWNGAASRSRPGICSAPACPSWSSITSTWPPATGPATGPRSSSPTRCPGSPARSWAGRTRLPACSGRRPGRRGGPVPGAPELRRARSAAQPLLAWLTGRDDGSGLRVSGAAAVPVPPPWR